MVDGGWTAAVESRISLSPRAEGVFHDEISTVQTSRREWPYAGCQPSLASMREKGAVPSAWFLQARQCEWRWRAGKRSEGGGRGLGPPVEVVKDLFDHGRIFDTRKHLDRTAAVLTGLDLDLEHPLQSLRLTLIATWGAGAGSLAVSALRWPRLAGVTWSRSG